MPFQKELLHQQIMLCYRGALEYSQLYKSCYFHKIWLLYSDCLQNPYQQGGLNMLEEAAENIYISWDPIGPPLVEGWGISNHGAAPPVCRRARSSIYNNFTDISRCLMRHGEIHGVFPPYLTAITSYNLVEGESGGVVGVLGLFSSLDHIQCEIGFNNTILSPFVTFY